MAALPTNRTTANTPAEHVADHNTLHADHNLLEGGSNGQVLTKVAGVAAWAAPSGSSVAPVFVNRTAGNLTFSSGTWSDLTTAMDLVLPAVAGDIVEVGLSAYVIPTGSGQWGMLDVASIVSGSAVNIWSAGSGGTIDGVGAWELSGTRGEGPIGGSVMKTLVSGDLSGGTVTVRLRCKAANNGNVHTVRATGQNPLQFWAKNHGQ